MFQLIKNSTFTPFFWFMLGLFFLNISVNPADIDLKTKTASTYNEQESLIEIIVEKVFGFEDAIAEQDDTELEDFSLKNNFKLSVLMFPENNYFEILFFENHSSRKIFLTKNFTSFHYFNLISPPPEMIFL
ncbi:hypothetical protein GV828_08935 [Flavobacterium sp. NST-5]|uniref:Uncharacterized protein n=1 Tax=Flavobacterium ichthyis TaxID=2698827 RepID=A0ABW9Z9F1_9FLAO|nr:hypothetical protein [Flavobacterium ichthyis]NBL65319.1 hypothetical protein [Flavobacterium ichthyis]